MDQKAQDVVGKGSRTERVVHWLYTKQEQIEGLQKLTIIVDIAGKSVKAQIVPGKEKVR